MSVSETLRSRRSMRSFSAEPVPDTLVQEILLDALQAPSWCNVQPYMVAIATGEKRQRLAEEYGKKWDTAVATKQKTLPGKLLTLATQKVLPDGDFDVEFNDYPPEFKERRQICGHGLYSTLGIERSDRQGRDKQTRRNFEFFDAPVVMFIFAHKSAREYGILDTGLFLQSLMLSAHEKGLGTCAQGALATWRSPIESEFTIPDNYKLVCGLSMGYADDDVVNSFSPDRIQLSELLISGSSING